MNGYISVEENITNLTDITRPKEFAQHEILASVLQIACKLCPKNEWFQKWFFFPDHPNDKEREREREKGLAGEEMKTFIRILAIFGWTSALMSFVSIPFPRYTSNTKFKSSSLSRRRYFQPPSFFCAIRSFAYITEDLPNFHWSHNHIVRAQPFWSLFNFSWHNP